MKKIRLMLLALLVAAGARAQISTGSVCSSATSFTANNIVRATQTSTNGWCEFTASTSSLSIVIMNKFDGSFSGRILKAIAYAGSCSTFTVLDSDTLSTGNDSLLTLSLTGLTPGNSYYIYTQSGNFLSQCTNTASCSTDAIFSIMPGIYCGFFWNLTQPSLLYAPTGYWGPFNYGCLHDNGGVAANQSNLAACEFTLCQTDLYLGFAGCCNGGTPDHLALNYTLYIFPSSGLTSSVSINSTTAALSLSPGVTYTILPNVGCNPQPAVTPSLTPADVIAANCGCSTSELIVHVLNAPTCSLSIPNPICAGQPFCIGGNTNPPYSLTWQIVSNPGVINSSGCVPAGLSTGTYQVLHHAWVPDPVYHNENDNYCWCHSSGTFAVIAPPSTLNLQASSTDICYGQSSILQVNFPPAGYSFTWQPGALTGSQVIVSPTVSTTYTVFGQSGACTTPSGTLGVTVYTASPTYTATFIDPFVCVPTTTTSTVSTLSMSPSGTYTLLLPTSPVTSSVFTNSISLTVTATTNYTVQQYDGGGCLTSATVSVTKVPCACLAASGNTLGGIATGNINLTNNVDYKVVSDFTLQGATNYFNQNDIVVYPGAKITISGNYSASTLNIIGSHLHGCGEMWKGIEILYTSNQLNVTSGTLGGVSRTSMIEDAYIGINAVNTPTDQFGFSLGWNTNVLTVDSAIFNKNITGIRIQNCNINSTSYPFKIMNSLFTSRNITYSVNSWPLTNTVKNSTSGATSSLQTPYIDNSTYSATTFSSSLYGYNGYPQAGIVLDNVGYTSNSGATYTFEGMQIGGTGTTNFNCFDNNFIDIKALNSNFSVINSVFQNGNRYGKASSQGGRGITALSVDPAAGAGPNRNQVLITYSGTGNNCRFYEKTSAADVTNYFSNIIENAEVYSYGNSYSNFYLGNTYGEKGFNIKTNRYLTINILNNKLYNIKNAMLIGLNYMPVSYLGYYGNYREIGSMQIYSNTVNQYIGTIPPGAQPYVNIGLNISDVTTGGFGLLINPGIAITANNFNKVNNGIQVSNIGDSQVGISTNTVVMINETPTYSTSPVQKGIATIQNIKEAFITQNSVTGPSTWGSELRNISTTNNTSLSVRCNTTTGAQAGIEFNHKQFVDFFEDNQMKNQTNGLRLDNSAVLTATSIPLGSTTRPTNNIWNGSWTSRFMASTEGGSSAQNGKLYIKYSGTGLDPVNSSTTTGNIGWPVDSYSYALTGTNVPLSTLLSASGTTLGCRIGSGGGGTGMSGMQRLFELAVQDSINYSINVSENQYMDKVWAYRSIHTNTDIIGSTYTRTILSNWYSNAQNSIQDTMVLIEKKLSNGAIDTANTLIGLFNPANTIESNYKLFYQLYSKTKDSTFTTSDSTSLDGLANSCPYTNGMVVYQARALFNIYFDGFYTFFNNCGTNGSAGRLMNPYQQEDKEEIKVELKSDIFPNPNDGSYTLKINRNVEKQSVEISIFDITGRLISKENRDITNGSEIGLKSDLKDGMYLLKVKFEDGSYDVHHLIISK